MERIPSVFGSGVSMFVMRVQGSAVDPPQMIWVCMCLSPSLVLYELSIIWLVAKNTPTSPPQLAHWPNLNPIRCGDGPSSLGSFPTDNRRL